MLRIPCSKTHSRSSQRSFGQSTNRKTNPTLNGKSGGRGGGTMKGYLGVNGRPSVRVDCNLEELKHGPYAQCVVHVNNTFY